ncbi:hypothetical protein Scep_007065 [Stephania cephalantha]|uniref:Uncharacterized protein n=1 Tax=Stephania cephalantha TaxID=152367 RepID=A0AAP0KAW4_9MAGN
MIVQFFESMRLSDGNGGVILILELGDSSKKSTLEPPHNFFILGDYKDHVRLNQSSPRSEGKQQTSKLMKHQFSESGKELVESLEEENQEILGFPDVEAVPTPCLYMHDAMCVNHMELKGQKFGFIVVLTLSWRRMGKPMAPLQRQSFYRVSEALRRKKPERKQVGEGDLMVLEVVIKLGVVYYWEESRVRIRVLRCQEAGIARKFAQIFMRRKGYVSKWIFERNVSAQCQDVNEDMPRDVCQCGTGVESDVLTLLMVRLLLWYLDGGYIKDWKKPLAMQVQFVVPIVLLMFPLWTTLINLNDLDNKCTQGVSCVQHYCGSATHDRFEEVTYPVEESPFCIEQQQINANEINTKRTYLKALQRMDLLIPKINRLLTLH